MASALKPTSKPINLRSMLTEIRNNEFSRPFKRGMGLEQYLLQMIPEFYENFDELKEAFDIGQLQCEIPLDEEIPEDSLETLNIGQLQCEIPLDEEIPEDGLETLNISHPSETRKIRKKSVKQHNFRIPQGNVLETLKYQKKDVDKRCTNEKYAMIVENDMQTSINPYTELIVKKEEKKIPNAITLPELLLTVKIYNSTNKLKGPSTKDKKSSTTKDKKSSTTKDKKSSTTKDKKSSTTEDKKSSTTKGKASHMKEPVKLVPSQELLVIGHQDLADLRKQILCCFDNFAPGEFSENPDASCTVTLKDLYPSGFFYINGTFYNDMQHPNSTDLSKVIREWAETQDCGIGPLTAQSIEGVQFIDLTIQLGYPYVFCHLGDCEHLFIFSEVSWSVTADMLPTSPHLICDDCLKEFFYTADGEKNAEFDLRKYCDQS